MKAADAIENEFDGLIDIFGQGIKQDTNAILDKYFKESGRLIEDEKKERTESYTVSTSRWYNPFSWGSSERVTDTYIGVATGAVHSHILAFRTEIENEISSRVEDLILESKKKFSSGLIGAIRRDVSDGLGRSVIGFSAQSCQTCGGQASTSCHLSGRSSS